MSRPSRSADPIPPLRVMRIIARLNIGGPARHVGLLSVGLRDRGYQTTVAYGEPDSTEGSLEELLPRDSGDHVKLAGLGRRLNAFGDLRALVALIRLMFVVCPDVVHTHTAKAGVLGRLAGALYNLTRRRRHRAVIVHTFHGNVLAGYFSAPINAAIRVVERALAGVTDAIIAIAPEQRHELVERHHVARLAKVKVIRLGLDLTSLLGVDELTPNLRAELGVGQAAVIVGYVGRLVPVKNVDLLIRGFVRLCHSVPDSVLVIAGDGPLRVALTELARDLGIAERVAFVGWRRDLDRLYRTMDLVALTSRNEGTPVALIEAMAAGRAVVATDVGGVADVVENGLTGLLVASNDVEAVAQALIRLARSRDERERLGAAGRRRVADRYTASRLIDEVDALYRTALDTKRGVVRLDVPAVS